jgi:hypothetical protein
MRRWPILVLLTLAAAPAPADERAASLQADAALADFGGTLRGALTARLKRADAVDAVDFCHAEAPAIAEDAAAAHGVRLGRVGVRTRNPGNAGTAWTAEVLAGFGARAGAGEAPETLRHQSVSEDGRTLRVARGIRVEPGCLACHGPAPAPPVAAAIAARYPADRAIGFAEGELRGLAWVEVPLAGAPPAAHDARAAIRMARAQAAALRAEMRGHLRTLQAALQALAGPDLRAVADAIPPRAANPRGDGSPGSDFRRRLPPAWFAIARPMHDALDAAATAAREGGGAAVVARRLAEATASCTGCHEAYRIEEWSAPAAATARR